MEREKGSPHRVLTQKNNFEPIHTGLPTRTLPQKEI